MSQSLRSAAAAAPAVRLWPRTSASAAPLLLALLFAVSANAARVRATAGASPALAAKRNLLLRHGSNVSQAKKATHGHLNGTGLLQTPADWMQKLDKSSKQYYLLQWVGLQENGKAMPRSPIAKGADLCLTVGEADTMGGTGLSFKPCQDPTIRDMKIDTTLRKAQLFSLTLKGMIRSKYGGQCVRRSECGEDAVGYDLGWCDDDLAVTFQVMKAIANDIDHMQPMGPPVQAVTKDACDMCGPYKVREECRGVQETSLSASCQRKFQAQPGWTKLPTQYTGDFKGEPVPEGWVQDAADMVVKRIGNPTFKSGDSRATQELVGIGAADDVGICGTFVQDGPEINSFFYFLRDKAGPP